MKASIRTIENAHGNFIVIAENCPTEVETFIQKYNVHAKPSYKMVDELHHEALYECPREFNQMLQSRALRRALRQMKVKKICLDFEGHYAMEHGRRTLLGDVVPMCY